MLNQLIEVFKCENVLNKKSEKGNRPSKQAYTLWKMYENLDLGALTRLLDAEFPEFLKEEDLQISRDYSPVFFRKNSKPYYIFSEACDVLEISECDFIRLAQFENFYLEDETTLSRFLYVFDKNADFRPGEEYIISYNCNASLQKQKNGDFWMLRFNGSKDGGNGYKKISSNKNRDEKIPFLRFAQHGRTDRPIVCSKSGEMCERITETDPLTGDHRSIFGVDYHHPKYRNGVSENKHNTKEPSNILTTQRWGLEGKLEILSCLPLQSGVHKEHHSIYTDPQDLVWWEAWWKSGRGEAPFVMLSEENYQKTLNFLQIPLEEAPSFEEFRKRLFW